MRVAPRIGSAITFITPSSVKVIVSTSPVSSAAVLAATCTAVFYQNLPSFRHRSSPPSGTTAQTTS
eukprot:8234855-Heterocapsa_arctica.AAC.1